MQSGACRDTCRNFRTSIGPVKFRWRACGDCCDRPHPRSMGNRHAMGPTEANMPGISALDELVDDWDDLVSQTTDAVTYDVAGRRVLITATDRALGKRMQRSLAHLRVGDHGSLSLEVIVCEGRQLGRDPYRMFGPTTDSSGRSVVVRGNGS